MSAIAFGVPMQFDKAYAEGIATLSSEDIRYAEELELPDQAARHPRRARVDGREGIELRVRRRSFRTNG
jgi:homoserine dehydrogenase